MTSPFLRGRHGLGALLGGILVLAVPVTCAPVAAGVVETPQCRARLARSWDLVAGIAAREKSVAQGDIAGLCRLLRLNLPEMVEARNGMASCLTGHERGENVGQMDVSIEDIRTVLARRCR